MTTTRSPRSPRWDLLGHYQVHVDGELMLDRLRIIQTPLFAVLLTRIHRPDPGRDPHDHSRWFASWILSGSYTECVHDDPVNPYAHDHLEHSRWSWHAMGTQLAHHITEVRQPLVTLVIAGRHRGTFWFWTGKGTVDWKDYG